MLLLNISKQSNSHVEIIAEVSLGAINRGWVEGGTGDRERGTSGMLSTIKKLKLKK